MCGTQNFGKWTELDLREVKVPKMHSFVLFENSPKNKFTSDFASKDSFRQPAVINSCHEAYRTRLAIPSEFFEI
jgi:hypothetical protein